MRFIIYAVARSILYIFAKVLFRYRTVGAENIPASGGFILASNHVSYADPPLVGLGTRRHIYFLAKKELFGFLPLDMIFKALNAVAVDRSRMERQTLKEVLGLLKKGEGVVVFPEGTRSENGNLQPGKQGIGFIAYLAKVRVIPAYIEGSQYILPKGAGFIRLRPCTVYYGKPMNLDPFYSRAKGKELYAEISAEIMRGIGALKDEFSK